MSERLKKHETIGCCGIDCGMCPRFYTQGDSVCPGCGGLNFKDKHPSCGYVTCCVIKKGYEVCSDCKDYPCKRFDAEKEGFDSFVSHQKIFANLDFIKHSSIDEFLIIQKKRMQILQDLLDNYDDGRSKSFYCQACTLIPIDSLNEIHVKAKKIQHEPDLKIKNKKLKESILKTADSLNINLKLKKR